MTTTPKNNDPKNEFLSLIHGTSALTIDVDKHDKYSKKTQRKNAKNGILESIDKDVLIDKGYVSSDLLFDADPLFRELQAVILSLNQLNESLSQLSVNKEGELMSDDLKEIKVHVNAIEKDVRELVTKVAVVENTIKLRFDSVDTSLKEIKESLKDSVTTKRWNITTLIASFGALFGAVTLILKLIGK